MKLYYDLKSDEHMMEVCMDSDTQIITKRFKCHSGHMFDRVYRNEM